MGALTAATAGQGCAQASNDSNETAVESKPAPTAPAAAAAPDVTASDTNVDIGQVRVMLSIPQRPVAPLEKEKFCVRAEIDGIPADLTKGHITFAMDMAMGEQRYTLVESEGCYAAEVVLPACPSGGTRWYATVEGVVDEQPVSARFQFDVSKGTATTTP